MSIIDLVNKLNNDHDLVVRKVASQGNRYRILRDYSGTYIQKYIESEEKMVDSVFRVFDAVKPERGRKLNVDPMHEFSIHNDSLFDYGSIIGYKLKKPWYLFNRLVAIHIPLCPNDCWHCFVPKELFTSFNERFKELSALQIVELFKNQRKIDQQHGKESNVLRITGGEPFLAPELLLEVLQIIQKDNELSGNVFVWTETNLEPFVGLENNAFMGNM